jgi:hypothetical protein
MIQRRFYPSDSGGTHFSRPSEIFRTGQQRPPSEAAWDAISRERLNTEKS